MSVEVRLAGARHPGAARAEAAGPVRCALVNNMPDAAFSATEQQFIGLLDAGSGSGMIAVTRYTMPGVPRGERIRARSRPTGEIGSHATTRDNGRSGESTDGP